MPSHVSAPHSPVAKASVNAVTPGGNVERPFATIGLGAPATPVAMTPPAASATGTYLYGLKTNARAAARSGAGRRSGASAGCVAGSAMPATHPQNPIASSGAANRIRT
jgi:hypothetical protein